MMKSILFTLLNDFFRIAKNTEKVRARAGLALYPHTDTLNVTVRQPYWGDAIQFGEIGSNKPG